VSYWVGLPQQTILLSRGKENVILLGRWGEHRTQLKKKNNGWEFVGKDFTETPANKQEDGHILAINLQSTVLLAVLRKTCFQHRRVFCPHPSRITHRSSQAAKTTKIQNYQLAPFPLLRARQDRCLHTQSTITCLCHTIQQKTHFMWRQEKIHTARYTNLTFKIKEKHSIPIGSYLPARANRDSQAAFRYLTE